MLQTLPAIIASVRAAVPGSPRSAAAAAAAAPACTLCGTERRRWCSSQGPWRPPLSWRRRAPCRPTSPARTSRSPAAAKGSAVQCSGVQRRRALKHQRNLKQPMRSPADSPLHIGGPSHMRPSHTAPAAPAPAGSGGSTRRPAGQQPGEAPGRRCGTQGHSRRTAACRAPGTAGQGGQAGPEQHAIAKLVCLEEANKC
jgi:hypothetical protein